MGASTSKTSRLSGKVPRCHYDILGIEENATAEEIKKAYKQKALLLHPDRNHHRVEEATSEFTLVQSAYQTLSDPQERSWYDRHKASIMRREASQSQTQYTSEILMKYFSTSCFSGFDDSQSGFFAVYRDIFDSIEEYENEDVTYGSSYKPERYTSFGAMNTPYEPSIAEFYEKWLIFNTTKSFDHIYQYDEYTQDSRRYRRAASKENQKLRDKQKREYVETVRELASFVQKRDPRYHQWKKSKATQRAVADKERKKAMADIKKSTAEEYLEPEWSRYNVDDNNLVNLLSKSGTADVTDDEEDQVEEFYCTPCRKLFKNLKQWENHEKSKKHKDKLVSLGFSIEFDIDQLDADKTIEDDLNEVSGNLENLNIEESAKDIENVEEVANDEAVSDTDSPEITINMKAPAAKSKKKRRAPKDMKSKSEDTLQCNTCKEKFDSRNQLFKHIEDEGHALRR